MKDRVKAGLTLRWTKPLPHGKIYENFITGDSMSDNKGMSKRQVRREQIRRKEQRSRFLSIGLVTAIALLLAFVFIYPVL